MCYRSLIYMWGPIVVLTQYLRELTKEDRPYPYTYYSDTQVLESIFPSVVLGGIIAVRQSISLSTKAFRIFRLICIHALFDALPLEGVPTWVTRVANNVRLSTTCNACMYDSPTDILCTK